MGGQINHLGQKPEIEDKNLKNIFSGAKLHISSNIEQIWYFILLVVYLTFQLGHIWLYIIQAETDRAFAT